MGMISPSVYQLSGDEPRLTTMGQQPDPRRQMLLQALGRGIQQGAQSFAGQGQPQAPAAPPPSPMDIQVNPMALRALGGMPGPQGGALDRILGRGGQPDILPGYLRTGGL